MEVVVHALDHVSAIQKRSVLIVGGIIQDNFASSSGGQVCLAIDHDSVSVRRGPFRAPGDGDKFRALDERCRRTPRNSCSAA